MKPRADLTANPNLPPVLIAAVKLRKAYGVSQREMAERMQVSRGSIENWERGKQSPRLADLERWYGEFGWRLIAERARQDARAASEPHQGVSASERVDLPATSPKPAGDPSQPRQTACGGVGQ